MSNDQKQKITIEIDNLTEAQALAIEDMLAQWQHLGGIGASRWTAFYADGDGNFRPRITVDGRRPDLCQATDPSGRWRKLWQDTGNGQAQVEMYMLDFDDIAWALRRGGSQ